VTSLAQCARLDPPIGIFIEIPLAVDDRTGVA
jgi:hypothetical protein